MTYSNGLPSSSGLHCTYMGTNNAASKVSKSNPPGEITAGQLAISPDSNERLQKTVNWQYNMDTLQPRTVYDPVD